MFKWLQAALSCFLAVSEAIQCEAGRHWQSPPGLPKRLAAAALLIAATSASAAATSTEPLSPANSKCVTPKGTPMVTVRRRPEEPGLRVDSCRFMGLARLTVSQLQ